MMIAYDIDRNRRAALPGATEAEKQGAQIVDATWARRNAENGRLRCSDPHCDVPLIFRQSHDGSRQPHWAHPAGTAEGCAGSSDPSGVFHRYMQFDVLGCAYGHEKAVPGARVDAVVQRCNAGRRLTGIEVQHSPIARDTIEKRHAAHRKANLTATLWFVNGAAVANLDAAAFADPGVGMPSPAVMAGVSGTLIRTPWVIDLLEACMDEIDYKCTVTLVVETAEGVALRFVDRVLITHTEDGARVALVTSWTRPVSEPVLREWAAGPKRRLEPWMEAERQVLDMAPERRVKGTPHRFWVKVNAARTRVRVAFSAHHDAAKQAGRAAGLVWHTGVKDFSDGTSTRVGYLSGPWSPQAQAFAEQWGGEIVFAETDAA